MLLPKTTTQIIIKVIKAKCPKDLQSSTPHWIDLTLFLCSKKKIKLTFLLLIFSPYQHNYNFQ